MEATLLKELLFLGLADITYFTKITDEAGFSLGRLHMGGFVPPPYGGTSAGGQSVNGGRTHEGGHRPYGGGT